MAEWWLCPVCGIPWWDLDGRPYKGAFQEKPCADCRDADEEE